MTAPLIRLADRLRVDEGTFGAFEPISLSDEYHDEVKRRFDAIRNDLRRGVPVIVADNVAEYYYNGSDREYWEIKDDFPLLVAPFNRFWCEWTAPTQVRSEVYGTHPASHSTFPFCACLVTVFPANAHAFTYWHAPHLRDHYRTFIDGADYAWRIEPMAMINDTFAVPCGDYWLATTADGVVTNHVTATYLQPPYNDMFGSQAPIFTHPMLLAISFMNLKNGALAPARLHQPEKWARAYEKRRKTPLVRYHTVVVDPSRTTKPDVSRVGTSDRVMPFHLVRGKMVTYRDEDGHRLFGKLHGTFFRPPHTRGSKEEGVSIHDYEVRAPRTTKTA